MSLSVELISAKTGKSAKIDEEGALNVVIHPHPPIDETISALPFRQYLTDNGSSTGSNDMVVNGSTNNTDFFVKAVNDFDIYIKSISVIIGDSGSTLGKFGNITALSNGVYVFLSSQDSGDVVLHEGLKTNLDFIRFGTATAGFGDAGSAFRADTSGSSADAYLPFIDLKDSFGLQWGVRLRKETNDKLIFRIRDDISGIDSFDAICYGIKI